MKNKKYLMCRITRNDGTKFNNELMLSEARLISKIAQENKSVTVEVRECSPATYKAIFGK